MLFFARCSSEDNPVEPINLIEKNKMTIIMGEIILLESYFQHTFGVPSNYKAALTLSSEKVFKKFGVTAKSYEDSFRFYAQQYEVFHEMNKVIIERQNKKLLDL